MNYITPTTICRDLSYTRYEYCSSRYTAYNYFWLEKCGDGFLVQDPQIYGWDDGNYDDGDGCDR